MTGHSIRKLCIFGVPVTWGSYINGVKIHDEVKNTAVACKLNTLNKNFDFAPIRYVFAFSTSWLHSLHFSSSNLFCCKIKAVLSSCSIHVPYPYPHRAWQHMDLQFFPHASKCDNARGRAHALCPLAHRHLPQRLLSPQRSLQTAILAGSDPCPLSRYRSLAATFALLEIHILVFWHCLHPCGPRAPSSFKFTQQTTSLLSCPVGKNICRVILFEWVILFKKSTVMALIGNYIHRVNVIKGSLYSRVYGTILYYTILYYTILITILYITKLFFSRV